MSSAPVRKILVVAGLVFDAGRLLIARRRPGDHLGGLWEFPGGKLEPGETPAEALRRELLEELDITVGVGDSFATVDHCYPDRQVQIEFLLCRWLAGTPRAVGCAAFAWVRPGELRQYAFPPADDQLLSRLEACPHLWLSPP